MVDNGSSDGSVPYLRDEHPGRDGDRAPAQHGLRRTPPTVGIARGRRRAGGPDQHRRRAGPRLAGADDGRAERRSRARRRWPARCSSLRDPPDRRRRRRRAAPRRGLRAARALRPRRRALGRAPGEVFGACAGRGAVPPRGGAGRRAASTSATSPTSRTSTSPCACAWPGGRCRYEPVVALHAAQGSSDALPGGRGVPGHAQHPGPGGPVLAGRAGCGLVAYRQLGWAWHAARERRLRAHLRALAAAVPMLPAALRERRALRAARVVPIEVAVPARPWRGTGERQRRA